MARNLVTEKFAGSTPRLADHLTAKNGAVRAVDCKLWHGTLESWRAPRNIYTTNAATQSIYYAHNCCWLESTTCAHFAEGSPEQKHIFATQYNDLGYPVRIILDSECNETVLRLGLPVPTDRPTAIGTQAFSKGAVPRQYAYQFVDSLGNFSSLSEPSEELIVEDGAAVLVSGWSVPTGGWDIVSIRIYRIIVAFESPLKEGENRVDATWMLVNTIPATQVSYTDTIADYDLIDALQEDVVEPPPANLRGITWVKSMNCLAGFAGNTLYFSENNNYHNWAHRLTLDDNIKAIVESNDIIYVATDSAPYVVLGATDCKDAGCRKATRMAEPLPLVGSGYRSMVAVPSGAVYPSHSGLVLMRGREQPVMLTAPFYAPDDWQALHPDTAKVKYHLGRVFAFFRNGAFCMAVRDGAGAQGELDYHTELSARPDEIHVTRTGRLMLRTGTTIAEWDRGTTLLQHRYEAASVLLNVPFNFGAIQVSMEPGTEMIQLYCDDYLTLAETINTSEYFPLPLWATGLEFRWVLTGTATVKRVSLAPSVKEL